MGYKCASINALNCFQAPLCLSVSELYWFVKREVKKRDVGGGRGAGGLVVFLTKEALCGAPERGTISASLCFILE